MKFFETFPTLKLPQDLADYMKDVEVVDIRKSSTNTLVRIITSSQILISKRVIFKVQDALKKQVFRTKQMKVRILDRYRLSQAYTPEYLINEYKESIELELDKYWTVAGSLFKNGSYEFKKPYEMTIVLEEGELASQFTGQIQEYFRMMFKNRFLMDVDVVCTTKERVNNRYERENEHLLAIKVQQISAQFEKAKSEAAEKEKENTKSSSGSSNNYMKKEERPEYRYRKSMTKSEDVLYGRDFDDDVIKLDTVITECGDITFEGMVFNVEEQPIRNERTILIFDMTDFTDSITCKMFVKDEELDERKEFIKKGNFLKVKGTTEHDKFAGEVTIPHVVGIKKSNDPRKRREDLALDKRIELHCHTKMSDMDAVSSVTSIIKQCISWGHKAVAITDHGNVQAFTEAYHTMRDLQSDYAKKGKELDFKVIYGLEGYIVDDTKMLVRNPKGQSFKDTFVVFDIETTGFSAKEDQIIEIGAVKVTDGRIVDRFSTFLNPKRPIPPRITKLTSITDAMVIDAPDIKEVLPKFLDFIGDAVLVAHNADFDTSYLIAKSADLGIEKEFTIADTVTMAQMLIPNLSNYKLDTVVSYLNCDLGHHHRAVDDAEATAGIFIKLAKMCEERDIFNLDQLNERGIHYTDEQLLKMHPNHCVFLARTEEGRCNLYHLVSESHMKYFGGRGKKVPRIPKSLVEQYREGIIIGSACSAGELFDSILRGVQPQEIARIVSFYDYLEVQPVGNDRYLIEDEDYSFINTEEDIRNINRQIVELGEKFHKPVVATCDVHFLNPEDAISRAIIQCGGGMRDFDSQPPLYLHTTEEMLHEFDYLGQDKAREIVVINPNRINDCCEPIVPVRPDKRPPVIEDSDQLLRKICNDRAHEIYGPVLPDVVEKRLDRELNSIISNGYSVMYIIAQKLVWKSNDDGYLVGSRGSVGSSFAATMAGITEVNPLSPHYLCPHCYYVDFDSEEVLSYSGGAGCDMPDKRCPKCGHKLKKMGFDIPFETFLGFKGNKEPDIDLNFSNEYQSKAHAYTEVIFGKHQTFKAGTIGAVADNTAFGYVSKYFEKKAERTGVPIIKRKAEKTRLLQGCLDVKRTTGQHPGGIVVLPVGEDINTFTPIQHPADDMTSPITTTHFDYHSIDHNLLKLDILGHLDPTMIRMLQDLTGVDPLDIPLDSKEVMSLFKDTSALGIKPEDIGGTKLGCLGIPEFGTNFAMNMLIETKPTQFSDLVRISGLSHGTDVYSGNAEVLIKENICTISTAICCRDDIMVYLIHMGLDSEEAFTIMERVRKGIVAKGKCKEWGKYKEDMISHGVPEWYISSCEKIKYMFPKGHAAAYVMMAWRVAWCKVFYPLAYYTAYFSIRAGAFDYEKMAVGQSHLKALLLDYRRRDKEKQLSNTESDELIVMNLCEEMYARGFDFMPVDIYRAKARSFQIFDGKIMPSFKVIKGVGESDGEKIEIAVEELRANNPNAKFLSKDDLKQKAGVGDTTINKLSELGLLDGMTDSNQLSIFDMTAF